MQQFVQKMKTEKEELEGKIRKLEAAIAKPPYGVDEEKITLMDNQLLTMKQYLHWLEERLKLEGAL